MWANTYSVQLRDDLLSMLVAGHETTGSVLTWTMYLLATNPDKMAIAQAEVDRVLKDKEQPTYADVRAMPYVMRCIAESMRLYPHPPVLIRRAGEEDTLPGGWQVRKNQDVMISGETDITPGNHAGLSLQRNRGTFTTSVGARPADPTSLAC